MTGGAEKRGVNNGVEGSDVVVERLSPGEGLDMVKVPSSGRKR